MDPDQYCRELESYLCRKNDGHLIRIVGPSFDLVSSWAVQGIPLKVACRGVDRYFDRYYAKGPRRRPVRIDFCEADVLDAFDEWRRAVGLRAVDPPAPGPKTRGSLSQHLDRVIARLTASRGGGTAAGLNAAIDAIVREIDGHRAASKSVRGDARAKLLDRLDALDRQLMDAAWSAADRDLSSVLTRDADEELRAFRDRMSDDAYEQARAAARDRLLREHLGLPTISLTR
jgi:hypothetical protein